MKIVTLKQAHKWLREEGHLRAVEPISFSLRRVSGEPAYCWTSDEADAILFFCRQTAKLSWLHAVLAVLAETGMRIGEATHLEWRDVDFENEKISIVDDSGRNRRDGAPGRRTKNRHSRSVPMTAYLKLALEEISDGRSAGRVLAGPRGGQLKADTVRRILVRDVLTPLATQFPKAHSEDRGFLDGRLHSFRHYFASRCANAGVAERITMSWLGHSSSDMIKIYYHLHDSEARLQMDKIDSLGAGGGRSAAEPSNHPGGVQTEKDEAC